MPTIARQITISDVQWKKMDVLDSVKYKYGNVQLLTVHLLQWDYKTKEELAICQFSIYFENMSRFALEE